MHRSTTYIAVDCTVYTVHMHIHTLLTLPYEQIQLVRTDSQDPERPGILKKTDTYSSELSNLIVLMYLYKQAVYEQKICDKPVIIAKKYFDLS